MRVKRRIEWTVGLAFLLVVSSWTPRALCQNKTVGSAQSFASGLPAETLRAAKRAVATLTEKVSTRGGYLWRYSADLSLREGEGVVESETVWVQPPGTPAVGLALTHLYQATGEQQFLDAALAAAESLRQGQMRSGGWQASIEFEPDRRKRWAYRIDPEHRKAKDQSSLDDNKTQSALLFLITLDETLRFQNEAVHEAALYGLDGLLGQGQFANGGFPQVWTDQKTVDHSAPKRQASYPNDWPREYLGHQQYWYRFTLNDHLARDTMAVLWEADRIYGDDRYRESAVRLADALLAAQMPDPQPAWAQQYNAEMQPIWARKFEPPAITTSESFGVIDTLLDVYQQTGDKKYLAPIPQALQYLKTCELNDGRVARFYELKTNRPLYFDRQYRLTYDDGDLPTHYGFKLNSKVDALQRRYRKIIASGPLSGVPTRRVSDQKVRQLIDRQREDGLWVSSGGMRYHKSDGPSIDMREVVENLETMAAYLKVHASAQ
ncbi:pectate lyase [Rhodopirellula sp. MGV]|uniref:pectate lyase n=1 Tax=Rhodopirellula sp. MGV TaxID=2023130 RepID=UPI000B97B685|nr:pectate lyase [Rhodopirellula sp. MGV]OYP34181.1 hypothetical protein CGZ80_16140 [Rhodopirellula sp. MGV]PNY33616.1 pectic acid lyase [Rhodopirellula baltica]